MPISSLVPLTEIRQYCLQLGFSLSDQEIESLRGYLCLLTKWNKVMNLVGFTTWKTICSNLIIDSFHLAIFIRSLSLPTDPLCWDFGSGAGLPGIPLRIIWKEGSYWLVESREKRAIFLKTLLAQYPLTQTYVYCGRVEEFMLANCLSDVALIVSSAFMPWQALLKLIEKKISFKGVIVLLLNDIPKNIDSCWYIQTTYPYSIGGEKRFFVALKKAS